MLRTQSSSGTQTITTGSTYASPQIVSLAGRQGFSRNARVVGFNFDTSGGGTTTQTRTGNATQTTSQTATQGRTRTHGAAPVRQARTGTQAASTRPRVATPAQTATSTAKKVQTATRKATVPKQSLRTRLHRQNRDLASAAPQSTTATTTQLPSKQAQPLSGAVATDTPHDGEDKKGPGRRRAKFLMWLKKFGRIAWRERSEG